jgi:hypothetical protein
MDIYVVYCQSSNVTGSKAGLTSFALGREVAYVEAHILMDGGHRDTRAGAGGYGWSASTMVTTRATKAGMGV